MAGSVGTTGRADSHDGGQAHRVPATGPRIESQTTRLAPTPKAPRAAREWLGWVVPYVAPGTADDLRLAVSELVTNAVLHAGLGSGDAISLAVDVYADSVRVTVCDCGRGMPAEVPREPPGPSSVGARGMYLVGRLTCGLSIDAPRGRVSFEVPRAASSA